MPITRFNLFNGNERMFYEYLALYHIDQYIPELFPDNVVKQLQTLRRIRLVVKRGVDEESLNSSGALLMMGEFQRPEGKDKEELFDELNKSLQDSCSDDSFVAWSSITSDATQRENLLRFLEFVVQTDIPMKSIGYILMQKLQQYIFWERYRSRWSSSGSAVTWTEEIPTHIAWDDVPQIRDDWEKFQLEHAHWISTQKKESLDGFAQENIFRCLKLISQHITAKIGNTEYSPIRVWIRDAGWIYRKRIPYLVARPTDDPKKFELIRLDQHDFVEKGDAFEKLSPEDWVDKQDIRRELGVSGNRDISGIYFYHGDPYICEKLGLSACNNGKNVDQLPIELPYQSSQNGILQAEFTKKLQEHPFLSEVERKLFIRSCGEFVRFEDSLPEEDWKSAEAWEKEHPYDTSFGDGEVNAEIGLASATASLDSICAPISCMYLSDKRPTSGEWNPIHIPQMETQAWKINDAELDWLHAVLINNATLAEQFCIKGTQIKTTHNEWNSRKESNAFYPSAYCEKQPQGLLDIVEMIWNQDFRILSSNKALTTEAMQKAMQCVREHKLLSYQLDKEDNDCLIYPYRFQITKERKIQLLTYDLKKFKLLTINDFGSSRYEDIKCVAPSELSEPAKRFLWCAADAAPEDDRDNSEKLLAAREIVYYYRLLVGEPKENPYTGNGYDCGKLRDMLDSLKTECESVKEQSVFKQVQVNNKPFSVCSRMIMGGNLWGNIKREEGIGNWTIAWWLRQYEKKLRGTTIRVAQPEKISSEIFDSKYERAERKLWIQDMLPHAFRYYKKYIENTYSSEQYAWNNSVYHSDKELRHMCNILDTISNRITEPSVSDDNLIQYIQAEIKNLNDAKQCTALLGIRDGLSMAKLDLIYHIFNEFDLTTEAVVCDPNDYDSEDANKFEIVHCIRVKYPSYAFRKLHEGILALQDFVYPLAPNDLKDIIHRREENMNKIYNRGGTTDE